MVIKLRHSASNTALWLAWGLGLAGYLTSGIADPDVWWHITVGKWILAHGQLPQIDLWNQFSDGSPWTAYSWTSEILFAIADKSLGIIGLFALKVLLALGLSFSLMYCLGRTANSMAIGAALSAILLTGIAQAFVLRPQTISWILMLWAILAAKAIQTSPTSYRSWIGAAAIITLWSNTHLSFIFGIIAILLWLLEIPFQRNNIQMLVKLALVLCCATLITPHLGNEWLTLLTKISHPFEFSYIIEFKSATLFHPGVPILIVLLLLQGVFFHYRPDKMHWGKILLVTTLALLGLITVKFMPYALICLGLMLAHTLGSVETLNQLGRTAEGLGMGAKKLTAMPSPDKFLLSGTCAVFGLVLIAFHANTPLQTHLVPQQAVDIIINQKLPMPILNAFGAGGYLIYRFSDEDGNPLRKVPLDGRTNVNHPAIIKGMEAVLNGTPQWRMLLEYVKPKTILWRTEGLFATLLLEHPDYCLVFPATPAGLDSQRYTIFVSQSDCARVKSNIAKSVAAEGNIKP